MKVCVKRTKKKWGTQITLIQKQARAREEEKKTLLTGNNTKKKIRSLCFS